MTQGVKLIPKRKFDWVPGTDAFVQHIDQFLGAPDTVRIIKANDDRAVLELRQAGSGSMLDLTETDQTDPAGRYRFKGIAGHLYLEKALTADWATDADILTIDSTNKKIAWGHFVDDGYTAISGGLVNSKGASITLYGENDSPAGAFLLQTPNAAKSSYLTRLSITGAVNYAALQLDYITGITWGVGMTDLREFTYSSATDDAVVRTLDLTYNTSGTPANNLGTGLGFRIETSTSLRILAGTIETIWTDVTHASRVADMVFSIEDDYDGTLEEYFRLDGSAKTILLNNSLDANSNAIINHPQAITDNAILTVDHVSPADDDYAKFTTAGLEGRSYAELRSDINMDALNEPTGFPNRTDSVLSFVAGTRTFTINKTNGSFDYYIATVKYTKSSAENIVIADTSGTHIIYYDGATLSESVNPNTATVEDILENKAWVATIYWNTTGAGVAPLLGDERHGTVMSGKTHHWLHDINGAAYDSGLTLSGYTEDTDSDAALTFELTDGKYYDEDLAHSIVDGSPATQYAQQLNGGDAEIPIVYKDASGVWVEDAASTLPYKSLGAGRLAYNSIDGNGNGSQVEVTDGKWVSMTLIATNDWQYPIKAIQGQNEYTDKKTAVEEATAEVISFGGGTLSPEVITLYRFVLNTKDTFSGAKKAKIEVDGVTDFRTSTVIGGAAVATDHGALGGLADDDHAQYILHSLADAANDFLVASGANTFAKQTLAQTLATISPLTTRGDMMFMNASVSTRLAKGNDNEILAMGANDPEWKTPAVILGDLTGANLDVGAFDVRGQTVTADGLTSGRVVFAGASGVLSDDGDFTFSVDTLTVTKIGAFQATGAINFGSQALTNLDINSGTIAGVTIDGDLTWSSAQTGVTLTSPNINGTIGTTGLTLPAFTSGNIIMTGAATVDGIDISAGLVALTTKGDLMSYSTVPARLGIGTDTHVLTADSGEATGMKWAAAAAGGATVATGNYTGDTEVARQITTGFKCSRVIIMRTNTPNPQWWSLIPSVTLRQQGGSNNDINDTVRCYLHATNGFVVSLFNNSNGDGLAYYYWAISE